MNESVQVVALVAFALALSALTGRPYVQEVLALLREHGKVIAVVAVFVAFLGFLGTR